MKNRPCAIVLARQMIEGRSLITVLLITHTPLDDPMTAIAVQRIAGVDEFQSA